MSCLVSGNESCGYEDRPTLSHCLDGIEYEVHKYLFHLFSVNPNLRQVKAKIPSNLNTFFLRFGLQYACNPVHNVIHIFFRNIGARWSRKTQKVVDQTADAINLLKRKPLKSFTKFGVVVAFRQKLGESPDCD